MRANLTIGTVLLDEFVIDANQEKGSRPVTDEIGFPIFSAQLEDQ